MTDIPTWLRFVPAVILFAIGFWWLYRGMKNTAKHAEFQKEQE